MSRSLTRLNEMPPCSILGCPNLSAAKGMCQKHYYRLWKLNMDWAKWSNNSWEVAW